MTANAMKEDRERGQAARFTDHLTKPVDVRVLLEVVDRHVGG